MRIVFNTEIKIEVAAGDDKLRDVFIKLVTAAAEQVYGSASMLSKAPPVVTVSQTSREGKQTLPLFGMKLEED